MEGTMDSTTGIWIDTLSGTCVNFRYIVAVKWEGSRAMLRISMVNGDVAYTTRFNGADNPARAFLEMVNQAEQDFQEGIVGAQTTRPQV